MMNETWQTLCPGCFQDKGRMAECPACGHIENQMAIPLALPSRSLLQNQYLIGRVLGKPGGFGITYLAFDTRLETRLAIKEYLPRDLVGRESGQTTVYAHSADDGDLFRFGLGQFLNEARTLAKFDHAHLVRVRNVFEENGTAYLVMDYYEGTTLAEYLTKHGPLPESTALAILNPILDGLREVHVKGFIHRDIKPQNIYLTRQGCPILLDFGAARLAMAERSRSLSVVLTPGYAPFEQYHRKGEQGAWTDVYACAAVLYEMLAGFPPPEATERVDGDSLIPLQQLLPKLNPAIVDAIAKGLAMNARQRFQNIRLFQDALTARNSDIPGQNDNKEAIVPALRQANKPWQGVVAIAVTVIALLVFLAVLQKNDRKQLEIDSARKHLAAQSQLQAEEDAKLRRQAEQLAAEQAALARQKRQIEEAQKNQREPEKSTPESTGSKAASLKIRYIENMLVGSLQDNNRMIMENKALLEVLPKPAKGQKKLARKINEEALLLVRANQFPQAAVLLAQAYGLDPSDVEIANNYGFVLMKIRELDKAGLVLTEVLAMKPDRASAWRNLADVLALKGEVDFATAAYVNVYRFSKDRQKTHEFFLNPEVSEDSPYVREAIANAIAKSTAMFFSER